MTRQSIYFAKRSYEQWINPTCVVKPAGDNLRTLFAPPEDCARPLELRGRVDAERHAVDDDGVDAHPRFERAQLLEFFALLERRRRQRHETGERGAAKGVKADVMIERPLAGRRLGAGEIERA